MFQYSIWMKVFLNEENVFFVFPTVPTQNLILQKLRNQYTWKLSLGMRTKHLKRMNLPSMMILRWYLYFTEYLSLSLFSAWCVSLIGKVGNEFSLLYFVPCNPYTNKFFIIHARRSPCSQFKKRKWKYTVMKCLLQKWSWMVLRVCENKSRWLNKTYWEKMELFLVLFFFTW